MSTIYLGSGACFIDYDNDGKIDILLADNGAHGAMSLYHNLGNGKFEDVTKSALGNDANTHAIGCTVGDYDNDGFQDIAFTTSRGIGLLHNEKNGTFKDVLGVGGISSGNEGREKKTAIPKSEAQIEAAPAISVPFATNPLIPEVPISVTFLDYDHDGDLDLYVTQSTLLEAPESKDNTWTEKVPSSGSNLLWRNNGNGTFTDVATSVGVIGNTTSIAAIGTDYNNDRAVDTSIDRRTKRSDSLRKSTRRDVQGPRGMA